MKQYLVKNLTTKEDHLCEMVEMGGFQYYVSPESIKDVRPYIDRWHIEKDQILNQFPNYLTDLSECKLVICTTNPSLDLPQVFDRVEEFAKEAYKEHYPKAEMSFDEKLQRAGGFFVGFEDGYQSSQSTHPFTAQDMVEFGRTCHNDAHSASPKKSFDELLSIWTSHQPIKVYCK